MKSENVYIVDGKIYDIKLIDKLKNDFQYEKIINNKIEYNDIEDINQKLLYIYMNFEKIEKFNFDDIDDTLIKILKQRKEIIQSDNKYEDIIIFYLPLFQNMFEPIKLSKIIDSILQLNQKSFNKMKSIYLIPDAIIELKNNAGYVNNLEDIKKMIYIDTDCVKYIDKDFKENDLLIEYIIDNNLINKSSIDRNGNNLIVDYIFNNISKNLLNNKSLVTKLILATPKTYKYINRNLIDKELINYLLDNFTSNIYYKNFCSDPRFYKTSSFRKFNNINIFNKLNDYPSRNEILNHDIIETISKYIPLERHGNNYYGQCPFHNDHNPSLCVSPIKQIWKCFSCGAHGNELAFVELYENEKICYLKSNVFSLYQKNMKNEFIYYLFVNLPKNLKNDLEIIKYFLKKDGCIFKLIPKEYKSNEELIDIAMKNDITSFRYFINNKKMVDKYLFQYPILDYYMPKHITRENINYTNSKEKKSKIIKEENHEEKEANSLSLNSKVV